MNRPSIGYSLWTHILVRWLQLSRKMPHCVFITRQKSTQGVAHILLFLDQMSVLDLLSRELVIDHVLALDDTNIDLETLRWIILIVLSNRLDEPLTYDALDNLLREDFANYVN